MKNILLPFYFLLLFQYSNAQNVGMGTTLPLAKLQVNYRSSSAIGLSLLDSVVNGSGSIEFRNLNNTRRLVMEGFAQNNFNNGQFLYIKSDRVFVTTFRGNGSVGIKNINPAYPLDVAGDRNTTWALSVNGNA